MKKIFLLFLLISALLSCKKYNQTPVPYIPTDVTIDFSLPSYSNLTGVGGWCYVNGGSRGIIVYRRAMDEFVAFDRHSPEDINGTCSNPLYPATDNQLELVDSCSQARFSLYFGTPISGSSYILRSYQTSYNGNNTLRIFN